MPSICAALLLLKRASCNTCIIMSYSALLATAFKSVLSGIGRRLATATVGAADDGTAVEVETTGGVIIMG